MSHKMLEQMLPRSILMSNGKRLSLDALLPFAIVPLFSIIGAVSFYLTVAVFLTVGALLQYLRCALPNIVPRTQFFFMWLLASVLYMLLIFHTIVITKLEILPEEHFALVVLIVVSTYFLYSVQRKAKDTYKPFYVMVEGPDEPLAHNGFMNGGSAVPEGYEDYDDSSFCGICIGDVKGQVFHSLWLDCCITTNSYTNFTIGTLIGICAFFYGANLMLTSICQPFIAFGSFLLPENCNSVYMYFDFSTCFVAGTYSVLIGVLLIIFMLMQFLENVRRPTIFKA